MLDAAMGAKVADRQGAGRSFNPGGIVVTFTLPPVPARWF